MISNSDGVVEKLSIEPGEAPKTGEEHIRIVSVKPMWVEVPVPRKIAIKLKNSGKAKVFFPDTQKGESAKIIYTAGSAYAYVTKISEL